MNILRLLYPQRCPICDEIVGGFKDLVCMKCRRKKRLLTSPWCLKCGKKLLEDNGYCEDCRKKKHYYEYGRALYEYKYMRESIYRFKYSGRREYAAFYGEEIEKYLIDFLKGVSPEGIIPIPLHKKRKNKRGYNQAALLANEVGRRLGIPVYEKLLVREKNTVALKYQNPSERQNNLKKAFKVKQNDVKLNRVIIMDDIYTTGSTIDEVSKTLKEHGVLEVYFLTLANGEGI